MTDNVVRSWLYDKISRKGTQIGLKIIFGYVGFNPGREIMEFAVPLLEEECQVWVIQNERKFGPIFLGYDLPHLKETIMDEAHTWDGYDPKSPFYSRLESANPRLTVEQMEAAINLYRRYNKDFPNEYIMSRR